MIRKHNRRAAKAAFAIALGTAIILGTATAAPAAKQGQQATKIVIGTKNFPEEYILGQLYKQALEAKGFTVGYKENIGSTELITTALTSGKITMYPEYVGISWLVTFHHSTAPPTAAQTYAKTKAAWEKKGYTMTAQTPFQDVDAIGVLKSTARKYGLKSIADLKKVPNLSIAAFPEFQTRHTKQFADIYGVKGFKFVPLASISAYELLDKKKIVAANVFTTDPQLLSGKYVLLKDPHNIFGFQHVAPIVKKTLVSENGAKFTSTLNKVSRLLTLKAMLAMNKAVIIDQKPAAKVAGAFLKANGLK